MRRGPDRYLPWKTAALVVGVLLILLANRLGIAWLVWVAIGVLLVGFGLRFGRQGNADQDASSIDRPEDD
jgi:membrane protein implicated in regulation of membrane protease activity